MQTILCPVDFSDCSGNAAGYAAALAAAFKARLILLHVYESPVALGMDPTATAVMDKKIRAEAERMMKKLNEALFSGNGNVRTETRLIEGRASDRIAEIAGKENADLVIMGTSGKGRAARIFIGSTSARMVRNAPCPVLCVPEHKKYKGIRKIVYATDMNEDNLNAAVAIVSFARKFDAELVFAFVDSQHEVFTDEFISGMTRKIRSHVRYNRLSGYIAKSRDVADGIRYFLENKEADLLVMFTHQKHFPDTLTNPSVTGQVLQDIKIPLLVLPPPVVSEAGGL